MLRLSDAQRADLAGAVEILAWTTVRETLQLGPDARPSPDLPDADLRQMWLAALTSLLAIRDSAEQLAASAALSAAQRGADYPAIGEAAGMTRQGARRKWPGLAGLSDERQRKLTWWASRGDEFTRCARAVLAALPEGPRPAALRERLDDIDGLSCVTYSADAFEEYEQRQSFARQADGVHAVLRRFRLQADGTRRTAAGDRRHGGQRFL